MSFFVYSPSRFQEQIAKRGIQPPNFDVDEEIFVILRSNKRTGRGKIVDKSSDGYKYAIAYDDGSFFSEVSVERILPVISITPPRVPCIIVCGETQDFRYLARTQLRSDASGVIIELGCSTGACTKILLDQMEAGCCVFGVDVSKSIIQDCAANNAEAFESGRLALHHCDVLSTQRSLSDFLPSGSKIAFVDINGDRPGREVMDFVIKRMLVELPSLEQVVVKNRDFCGRMWSLLEAERPCEKTRLFEQLTGEDVSRIVSMM
jgi:SAM-dependent methyltransferase